MVLDDFLADREPQAATHWLIIHGVAYLAKLLKYLLVLIRRDARTIVLHLNSRKAAGCEEAYTYLSCPVFAELHRV